nr:MAG TPA: hypothetical protein [Caudoviricetes sp.]
MEDVCNERHQIKDIWTMTSDETAKVLVPLLWMPYSRASCEMVCPD